MKEPVYIGLANKMAEMIEKGVFKPEDKLPSLRSLHKENGLSIGTILQAFNYLIDKGLITSREKSGYFVNHRPGKNLPVPLPLPVSLSERTVHIEQLLQKLHRESSSKKFVNAAKEAGVKHIIYTSFVRKNETETSSIALIGKSHIETEKHIKASGISYTVMLNSLYADVLPMFMGEKVLETGIFLPAGEGKASFTTRLDMAEAAASIFTSDGHENKEYIIANDSNYSLYDVASIQKEQLFPLVCP